jgi:hypothetical protein
MADSTVLDAERHLWPPTQIGLVQARSWIVRAVFGVRERHA